MTNQSVYVKLGIPKPCTRWQYYLKQISFVNARCRHAVSWQKKLVRIKFFSANFAVRYIKKPYSLQLAHFICAKSPKSVNIADLSTLHWHSFAVSHGKLDVYRRVSVCVASNCSASCVLQLLLASSSRSSFHSKSADRQCSATSARRWHACAICAFQSANWRFACGNSTSASTKQLPFGIEPSLRSLVGNQVKRNSLD